MFCKKKIYLLTLISKMMLLILPTSAVICKRVQKIAVRHTHGFPKAAEITDFKILFLATFGNPF
jgi:hypothetical protein